MRYLVFVKQVPDTTLIEVDEQGNLRREGVPSILDPYSEHALELALNLRSEGDSVTVVTMGPPQATAALRRCLEIGADEAYLLSDRAFAGADTYATSRTLTAFVEKFGECPDLILFGKQAADGDTAQVPAEVAEMLGADQFYYVTKAEPSGEGFEVVQDYGDEAVATLLKRMEDDRDKLVVIVAGYTDEMKHFIDSNPGLQSRFNRYINFPDYTPEELYKIFRMYMNKNEYTITKEAATYLRETLEYVVEHKDRNFGNARYVRNVFEKAIQCQANRISKEKNLTEEQLTELTLADIKKAFGR